MHVTTAELEARVRQYLSQRYAGAADDVASACVFLESCGYPGVRLLVEALSDGVTTRVLERDLLGLDLDNVSCVFLAPAITADVIANGRAFLRNVRHGLYLLPHSVRHGLAIGCPVDPAFAYGGSRDANPYAEKLAAACATGLDIADDLWAALTASPDPTATQTR